MTGIRTTASLFLFAALAGGGVRSARAEKAPEDKQTVDYVVTGKVLGVYERRQGRKRDFVVKLQLEQVHHGDGLKPGEIFYVSCFQMIPALIPQPEPSGHDAPPKQGQRIKAYIRNAHGAHAANYPEWFEVLEEESK